MKVMVVEHQQALRHLIETLLDRWGHNATTASSVNEVWAALVGSQRPDVLVLDWMTPDLDAIALCRAVKEEQADQPPYVLMLTEQGQRDDIIAGIDAGVDDYVQVPLDARELKTRLRTAQRIVELNQQLGSSQLDAATGLWRREAIMDILSGELNRCRREGRPLSIALAEIAGGADDDDILHRLRSAARRARRSVRSYDSVGYYGPQSLLIVLPGCNQASAGQVCGRIRAGIDEQLDSATDGPPSPTRLAVMSLPGGEHAELDRVLRALEADLGSRSEQ